MYRHEVVYFYLPLLLTIATIIFSFILIRKLFHNNDNSIELTVDSATSTSSSSSSSSTSSSSLQVEEDLECGEYEVFLSFRGEDTRTSFTDYLYTSLVGASIRTFRDDNELRIGEEIGSDLLKAINESKILIPIFSKNYAASKWCLIELAQMVECNKTKGKMIFPIFYDVEPSDVRNKKGSYEKAFRQHEKKFGEPIVQTWKDAMTMIGKLKGLELKKATNGHEGELVKMIVEKVMLALKKNYTHLPDILVGMDNHVEKMERLLDMDYIYNGVRVVGIFGMGGIGKTTVSKFVFNRLLDRFEGCCFLDDVRERSQHNGVTVLQHELVCKITKKELACISNVGEGIRKIKDVVHKRKVLIVLDDIDEISQFDSLIGNCDWFCPGSKIIITTRNKEVLDTIQETCRVKGFSDVYKCYEPQFMNDDHSLELFCNFAFKQGSPPQAYDILSKNVVSTASGLPLVLVTLGSLLFGKNDRTIWTEILKKLKKIPNKDVLQKLRISFDSLEHEQKQIFLDISCLFIGHDKTYPSYMWDACEYYPKSGIHTLVLRSLIRVGDDNTLRMHDQLRDLGRQIVREENLKDVGWRSRVWDPEEASDVLKGGLGSNNLEAVILKQDELDPLCFNRQRNLRYLVLEHVELHGDFKNIFPKLRWLVWKSWGKSIPININLKNIVILELSLLKLKDERDDWSLFKEAKRLKVLSLSKCNSIKKLSSSTFEDLEILTIVACHSLLEVMDLSCSIKLREATFDGCDSLTEIQGLQNSEVLEFLLMKYSSSIKRLPDLSKLKMLKQLRLEYLENLLEIESLGGMESLQELVVLECGKLRNVGDFGGLESLNLLSVRRCRSLERLTGFSKLRKLKNVCLDYCMSLTEVEGLKDLVSLEILGIGFCDSIGELLVFSENLKNLKILTISFMKKLREIEGLNKLTSLESLSISYCDSFRKFPDLFNLTSLKRLHVNECKKLSEIECLRLVSLEHLDLRCCISLRNALDLSFLKILKELDLQGSKNLTEITGLEQLRFLEVLDISSCSSLKNLSDLSNLENLKALRAKYCAKLVEIQGLEELKKRNCKIEWTKVDKICNWVTL